MKTLITGATGFIGSTVLRFLLDAGRQVKVLHRPSSDTRNIDGLDVEKVEGDLRDSESIRNALKGCDTLFHVAAYFAHWSPHKKLFYETNVDGTKNLFQLVARETGVSPPRIKLPYLAALSLAYALETVARVTRKPPVISTSQVIIGHMGEHFDNTKAVRELNLTLTPIEETVAKTHRWFRDNGYITQNS